MRFAILGSGSRGNATLIEEGGTSVLVDCGFSIREMERRLARLGKSPDELSAVLVTHEHSDHIGGVGPLARKYKMPVWMTPGTHAQQNVGELPDLRMLNCHEPVAIGDLLVEPFPVPHDAREPTQFVFANGAVRLGVLTDVGRSTPHIEEVLGACDALIMECNHDEEMLANGPYPAFLKARVAGQFGHLSNGQAGAIVRSLDCAGLQHIVAAHLSEKNNRPELAVQALSAALDCEPEWIAVAAQDAGLGWREIA